MPSNRWLKTKLGALQAANFAGIGIYMPFIPPWLASQGLSERQIGLVLAMGMIIRMLVSQSVTALGDGRHGAVRVLALLHLLGAASFLSLMAMPSPEAIIAAMAVIALLSAGIIPLGDHLTIAHVRSNPSLDFSRIRLWGSVAFLVVSTMSGVIVSRYGIATVPLMLCLCSLVAMLVTFSAPDHAREAAVTVTGSLSPDVTRQRSNLLWLVIVSSSLINASHSALYGFGTLHWRSLGIDDSMIGILWSSAVVAEIAMFWWFGRSAAASWNAAVRFLAFAGIAAMIRFALMPFAVSLPAILSLQMLHALSFGAQLMGVMTLVGLLAPEGRRALVLGRLSAANACLMGAATLGSGYLYESLGAMSFVTMVPIALSGLIILAIAARSRHTSVLDMAPQRAIPLKTLGPHDDPP